MTGFHKINLLKAKMITPHFLFSLTAARLRPAAVGLIGWAFPVMDEPAPVSDDTRARSVSVERITPTAIVLLGLVVILMVAFMVGTQSGGLHPVWQAIVGLAGVGIAGMTLRLVQILRGKGGR